MHKNRKKYGILFVKVVVFLSKNFKKFQKAFLKFPLQLFLENALNLELSQILCLLSKISFETLATKISPNEDTKFSELVKKKTNRSDEGFLRIQRN